MNDVLKALGRRLFDEEFCTNHLGEMKLCTNSVECSIRSLWTMVQSAIDKLLDKITLADLSNNEKEATFSFQGFLEAHTN